MVNVTFHSIIVSISFGFFANNLFAYSLHLSKPEYQTKKFNIFSGSEQLQFDASSKLSPHFPIKNHEYYTKPFFACLAAFILSVSPIGIKCAAADNEVIKAQLMKLENTKTQEQQQRVLGQEAANFQNDISSSITEIIAKGRVSIPSDVYPLGIEDATVLEGLDGPDASLIVAAYGNEGRPVVAKRFRLKEIKFPFALELTKADLLFPYTGEAWDKDPKSKEKLGIVALLDGDGLTSTVAITDYVSVGESGPIKIAGSAMRSEGKLQMRQRITTSPYSETETYQLRKIDAQLDSRDTKLID